MKLIKLLFAAMMALALVAAQTGNQDDCGFRFHDDGSVDVPRPDGSPRTLQLGEFSINQSNGSLTVNKEGEPDNGATITPPPCGDQGGDHEGGQCRYEGCDFVGNTDDDWRGHCDANPDHCMPQAGDQCHECDYVFTGTAGEEHGHCRECQAAMNSPSDWDDHCRDNPDHCMPQAGDQCHECDYVFTGTAGEEHGHCDQCDYVFSGEGDRHGHCDKCDHIYNSDDDRHGHCDQCDFAGNSEADWQNHHHDDGGGDGPQHYPNNHWDGNCGAMMNGESEYWLDSDGDPDNGPEDGPYAVWHEDADGNPVNCDPSGDCGGFPGNEDGSIMVAKPDGSERWLQVGEYTMNEDGSVTVNRPGDPDDGATVTPPPCDDGNNN